MFEVKVLTGRTRDRKVTSARSKMSRGLIRDGWMMVSVDPNLHPAEIVEDIDKLIDFSKKGGNNRIFFVSNCDHVFNRIRVLRSENKIDSAEFVHFALTADTAQGSSLQTVKEYHIDVTPDGECTEYPHEFLDEWNNHLLQLWASSEERANVNDKGDSHE